MTAPRIPNPSAVPIAPGGTLAPEWVRYFAALLAYIDALEARIAQLEAPP